MLKIKNLKKYYIDVFQINNILKNNLHHNTKYAFKKFILP